MLSFGWCDRTEKFDQAHQRILDICSLLSFSLSLSYAPAQSDHIKLRQCNSNCFTMKVVLQEETKSFIF